MNPGQILFVASGPIDWGSARMRCYWPAQEISAKVLWGRLASSLWYEHGAFSHFVFQKTGSPEIFEHLHNAGKKVIVDLCDPVWWMSPAWVQRSLPFVDVWTVSTDAAADDLLSFMPGKYDNIFTINDCIDLKHFPQRARHDVESEDRPIKLIWFGIMQNRVCLPGVLPNLNRLAANDYEFELTIFDEQPDYKAFKWADFKINHELWKLTKENEVLAAHDIAVLPPYPGPWGKIKSNNKIVTAYACGLPVTDGFSYHELKRLVFSYKARKRALPESQAWFEPYLVENVAGQWLKVLENA